MRRENAILLAAAAAVALAGACGGKVVLDPMGSSTSSSTGLGGTSTSSTLSSTFPSSSGFGGTTADFMASSSMDFAASSSAVDDAVSTSTGVSSSCGAFQLSTSPACDACVAASCCGQLLACDVGTPCAGFVDCSQMCAPGDSECLSTCDTQWHEGVAPADMLTNCYTASCAESAACSAGQAEICDSGVMVDGAACAACLGDDCCAEFTACVGDMACVMCLEQKPTGAACAEVATFTTLSNCVHGCAMTCDM